MSPDLNAINLKLHGVGGGYPHGMGDPTSTHLPTADQSKLHWKRHEGLHLPPGKE